VTVVGGGGGGTADVERGGGVVDVVVGDGVPAPLAVGTAVASSAGQP